MGLITQAGAENRVLLTDKLVTYSKTIAYGSWTYTYGTSSYTRTSCWQYHRYCTKSYMYVGMTLSAARTCAAAMVEKYTRDIIHSDWTGNDSEFRDINGGSIVMADISVQKRVGHMYDVVITVREDDVRQRMANVTNIAGLFSAENARDYDE